MKFLIVIERKLMLYDIKKSRKKINYGKSTLIQYGFCAALLLEKRQKSSVFSKHEWQWEIQKS